jgi:acyl-CoA synthetase (NDP forming)
LRSVYTDDEAVKVLQDAGITVYPTPEKAVRAMAGLWEYKKIREKYQ